MFINYVVFFLCNYVYLTLSRPHNNGAAVFAIISVQELCFFSPGVNVLCFVIVPCYTFSSKYNREFFYGINNDSYSELKTLSNIFENFFFYFIPVHIYIDILFLRPKRLLDSVFKVLHDQTYQKRHCTCWSTLHHTKCLTRGREMYNYAARHEIQS